MKPEARHCFVLLVVSSLASCAPAVPGSPEASGPSSSRADAPEGDAIGAAGPKTEGALFPNQARPTINVESDLGPAPRREDVGRGTRWRFIARGSATITVNVEARGKNEPAPNVRLFEYGASEPLVAVPGATEYRQRENPANSRTPIVDSRTALGPYEVERDTVFEIEVQSVALTEANLGEQEVKEHTRGYFSVQLTCDGTAEACGSLACDPDGADCPEGARCDNDVCVVESGEWDWRRCGTGDDFAKCGWGELCNEGRCTPAPEFASIEDQWRCGDSCHIDRLDQWEAGLSGGNLPLATVQHHCRTSTASPIFVPRSCEDSLVFQKLNSFDTSSYLDPVRPECGAPMPSSAFVRDTTDNIELWQTVCGWIRGGAVLSTDGDGTTAHASVLEDFMAQASRRRGDSSAPR